MTEKQCTNCKYTKGIGYDFWCGEGHTEYEVFGAETNCPYYEYHDWSKGIPSKAEKRFTINYEERTITDNKEYLFDLDDFRNKSAKEMVELLNELHEENEELKQRINELELLNDGLNYALQNIHKIDVEVVLDDRR
ncbi:MAG: hypothetical protein IKF82_00590 [Bacilli bacterium]|nr:hypothetical protein [Bacilli bacterium]